MGSQYLHRNFEKYPYLDINYNNKARVETV